MHIFRSKYRYQFITLFAHVSLVFHFMLFPSTWYIVFAIFVGWVVSTLGHNLFAHRVLTHRHFNFSRRAKLIGHMLFSALNIGSIVTYCSVHLKHHSNSGKEKDPHDHHRIGWFRATFNIWDKHYLPEKRTYRMFLADGMNEWFHRHHILIALLSAIFTPYLVVVSFWLQRILVIVVHIPFIGKQSPNTPSTDTSANVWWLKPIMLGEELHNNHHLYAGRANHNINGGFKEFDPMYYIGKWIEKHI